MLGLGSVYLCVVCSRGLTVVDIIYNLLPFVGVVDCPPCCSDRTALPNPANPPIYVWSSGICASCALRHADLVGLRCYMSYACTNVHYVHLLGSDIMRGSHIPMTVVQRLGDLRMNNTGMNQIPT